MLVWFILNSCAFICQLSDIRVKIGDNTHKVHRKWCHKTLRSAILIIKNTYMLRFEFLCDSYRCYKGHVSKLTEKSSGIDSNKSATVNFQNHGSQYLATWHNVLISSVGFQVISYYAKDFSNFAQADRGAFSFSFSNNEASDWWIFFKKSPILINARFSERMFVFRFWTDWRHSNDSSGSFDKT